MPRRVSSTALNCGTPTPATTRVVQMLPGPMPIFTASAPASISARAPSGVATLPAITCTALRSASRLDRRQHALEWPCAVSTTITSTSAAIRASARAQPVLATPVAAATRSRPNSSLLAQRVRLRLVHVLDGDQPDAAVVVVDHQQLLDPVPVEQLLGILVLHLAAR